MTRDPVGVVASAPVDTAAHLMLHHHFRHLPVIDEASGKLLGMVDDASVFARGEWQDDTFRLYDRRDDGLRVSDVMHTVHALSPTDPLARALAKMIRDNHDAVIAVDGDRRPVGIFTAHDAIRIATWFLGPTTTTRTVARDTVLAIPRGQSVGTALDTMRAHHARHVVVVDDGRPVGVIGWRDLMAFDAELRRSRPVGTLGAAAVETVLDGASLLEVADRMVAQKVGVLPVVDGYGVLVGVVSRTDIMQQIAARLGSP